MKPIVCLLFLALLIGCATGAPPTATERALYHVTTNFVTNISQIAQVDTNRVVTNVVFHTNIFATFDLQPRESVESGIRSGGTVATGLGALWLVPLLGLLGGLYGWWAEFRNRRKDKAVNVLTNNVEVGKETILATAGVAVAAQFLEAIKSAQVKAGVKSDIAAIVDSKVDTAEARNEAASVVSMAKRNPAPWVP